MSNKTMIDVWISKYALTSGVEKARAEHDPACPGMIAVDRGVYRQYFHGKHWHRSEKAALDRANQMRLKKVAALTKQIARLQELTFKVVTRG